MEMDAQRRTDDNQEENNQSHQEHQLDYQILFLHAPSLIMFLAEQ